MNSRASCQDDPEPPPGGLRRGHSATREELHGRTSEDALGPHSKTFCCRRSWRGNLPTRKSAGILGAMGDSRRPFSWNALRLPGARSKGVADHREHGVSKGTRQSQPLLRNYLNGCSILGPGPGRESQQGLGSRSSEDKKARNSTGPYSFPGRIRKPLMRARIYQGRDSGFRAHPNESRRRHSRLLLHQGNRGGQPGKTSRWERRRVVYQRHAVGNCGDGVCRTHNSADVRASGCQHSLALATTRQT